MLTILFWNVGRRPLNGRVAMLARHHNVDIVLLAECANRGATTRKLNSLSGGTRYFPVNSESRVAAFTRFPPSCFRRIHETRYYSIRELTRVGGVRESLLIICAHLPSKREVSEQGQVQDACELSRAIVAAEDGLNHTRSLVVGDLNMNPFKVGVVSGAGLHGVMTREIARGGTRTVRGREYRFFYNPMWRFFGDGTRGPAGTHYHRRADEVCFFWNVFDQALIRPSLLAHLPPDGVQVLDSDGVAPLLTIGGRLDTDAGSDHLPILVQIDV